MHTFRMRSLCDADGRVDHDVDPRIRYVSPLALSADSRELAAVHMDGIVVWDAHSGEVDRFVGTIEGLVPLLRWSPDGTSLLTSTCDGRLLLRDPLRDEVTAELVGHDGSAPGDGIIDAAFSPDGDWVVSVGTDHSIRRWDATARTEVARADLGPRVVARRIAFSPSGDELVVPRAGGPALLLDAMTLEKKGELGTVEAAVASPRNVVFGPDGSFLAALSSRGIWMGRINDSDLRQIVALPRPDTTHALFSRDGVLYTSTGRGGIRAWDPATGRMLRTFADPPRRIPEVRD